MANLSQLAIVFLSLFSASLCNGSAPSKEKCDVKKKFFGCFYFNSFDKCFCTTRRACSDPFPYRDEQHCQDKISKLKGACKRHPCLNSGKCEALKSHSKYTCDCTGTGFYGKRCHKACPRSSDISLDWLQGYSDREHWQDTPLACIMDSS